MNYNHIYQLSDNDSRDAFNACGSNSNIEHEKLFKGEVKLDILLNFRYNYGGEQYDLINTGFAGLYLFSDKVIKLLTDNKVKGWMTYPCMLFDKLGKEILGYSFFAVIGRCGPIDWQKSEMYLKQYTPTGRPAETYKGLYFGLDTWDGSDIFSPEGTLYTFISEDVKNILESNEVSNISFERITEIETLVPNKQMNIDPEIIKRLGW